MRGAPMRGTARGCLGEGRGPDLLMPDDGGAGAGWRYGGAVVLLSLACLLGPAASGTAQPPGRTTPPILTESLVGSDLYATYCSSCHGRGGKGDGPEARTLAVKPSDLTTLARRHNGVYPADMVRQRLNGTPGPGGSMAHGSTEMPVWGAIFRELDAKPSVAKVRVDNLVSYLQSIQAK
ncbi:MAG: cytochrome c [Vicinamibacterales bacterium]